MGEVKDPSEDRGDLLREPNHSDFSLSGGGISANDPGLSKYREALSRALSAIESLDCGEASYKKLWRELIALDRVCHEQGSDPRKREEVESALAQSAGFESPNDYTISNLLIRARESLERSIRGAHSGLDESLERLESFGLLIKRSDKVYVETGEGRIEKGSGEGRWEETRYAPRLEELIAGLQEAGVYKDDFIIRVGAVRSDMMRRAPYVIVEIPKLNREVAVCNEVGEITFVSTKRFGPEYYSLHTKEELRGAEGISAIVYRNKEQWLNEIKHQIFESQPERIKKVDVRDRESIRDAIINDPNMSAESWAEMNQIEKSAYKVPGTQMRLKALATKFGVKGEPTGKHAVHLELGEGIFGKGTVISERLKTEQENLKVKLATKEEIAEIIKSDPNMNAEKWADMIKREKSTYKIPGSQIGLVALARKFGVKGDPPVNYAVHLELGERIFGKGTVISERLKLEQQNLKVERATIEELKEIIKSDSSMSAERWVAMRADARSAYKAPGTQMGLHAIATKFGVNGNPISKNAVHLELGEKIFGKGGVISERLRIERATKEELAEMIKSDPNMSAERWADMIQREKVVFRAPGTQLGLMATATKFGIKGSPLRTHALHLELGEKIFGKGTIISERLKVERATMEELKEIIKNDPNMSPQSWADMIQRIKSAYKAPGSRMGLFAIATKFGVRGDPIGIHVLHLELGEKIFGKGTIISERLRELRARE